MMVTREQAIAELNRRRSMSPGVTREEAIAELKRRRLMSPEIGLAPKTPIENQEPSFTSGVSDSFSKRIGNVGKVGKSLLSGQIGIPEAVYNYAGQSGGLIGDVIGEGVMSVGRGVAEVTPELIKEPLRDLVSAVGDTETAKYLLDLARRGDSEYQAYAKENPRVAMLVNSTLGLGALPPKLAVAGGAAKAAKSVASPIAGKADLMLGRDVIPTSAELKKRASGLYVDSNESLSDAATGQFLQDIKKLPIKTEFAKKLSGSRPDPLSETIKNFEDAITTEKLTLQAAQESDQVLRKAINAEFKDGRPTPEAQELMSLQDKFRDLVRNPDKDMFEGGNEGFKAWKEGSKQWAQARKVEDIEDLLSRAELANNPAQGIKSEFSTFVKNKKRMNFYSKEEQKALRKVAKFGLGSDFFNTFGSKLGPIIAGGLGASVGGGLGAAGAAGAAYAASGLSRSIATSMKKKQAQDVLKSIASQSGPLDRVTRSQLIKDAMGLPPKEAKEVIDQIKNRK